SASGPPAADSTGCRSPGRSPGDSAPGHTPDERRVPADAQGTPAMTPTAATAAVKTASTFAFIGVPLCQGPSPQALPGRSKKTVKTLPSPRTDRRRSRTRTTSPAHSNDAVGRPPDTPDWRNACRGEPDRRGTHQADEAPS